MKYDGTRAETRFRLSAKRTSPFKLAEGRQFSRLLASRGVRISGSNSGYTVFRGSVKSTGYTLNRRRASVQSTTGSRGVRISGSNSAYTMFRGNVKSTGYPLHSSVSSFTPPTPRALPCAITFQLESTSHQNKETMFK